MAAGWTRSPISAASLRSRNFRRMARHWCSARTGMPRRSTSSISSRRIGNSTGYVGQAGSLRDGWLPPLFGASAAGWPIDAASLARCYDRAAGGSRCGRAFLRRYFTVQFSSVTLFAMCVTPAQASVAYIVNCCNNPSTVSVFSTATGRQKAQWTVGNGAADVVFSPNGSIAYISNSVSESVTVVRVSTGATLATIPIGYGISRMAITPDGSKLFAESYDYAYESHLVAIDTITLAVSQEVGFAAFLGPMAISPDGKTLDARLFPPAQPGLLVLDTAFLTVKTTVPIVTAVSVAVTPDGKFAYVPNFGAGNPYNPNVAVVDTSSNAVVATITLNADLNRS